MSAWILGSWLLAAPITVVPHVECGAPAERCDAVRATLASAAQKESMTVADAARCGDTAGCVELWAKVQAVPVTFELRDARGLRFIAQTSVTEYREPHSSSDGLVMLGFLTVVFAPIAYDLRAPTTRADEERAWTLMARRVLRQGAREQKTYLGVKEARGQRFAVTLGTPGVRGVRSVTEDQIVLEKDFEPVAPESDEAKEAAYGAGVVLSGIVSALDETPDVDIGDGKARLVVIHDAHGQFRPLVRVSDNKALNLSDRLRFRLKLMVPRAQGVPIPGYTLIDMPITIRRLGKK